MKFNEKKATEKRFEIIERLNQKIVEKLEAGIIPWQRPWFCRSGGAVNINGRLYSGINQLILDGGCYATFQQIQEHGGRINKGAKGNCVIFWKRILVTENNEIIDSDEEITNIEEEKVAFMLKAYHVYDVKDTTDMRLNKKEAALVNGEREQVKAFEGIDALESIMYEYLTRERISLERGGNRAYYSPSGDYIRLPIKEDFNSSIEYYSTAMHEIAHSTGHENRLNRFNSNSLVAFGDQSYSKEELVAELTSAYIINSTGNHSDKCFDNNIAYLQSWLRALKNDKHMVFYAMGKAEKAFDFILADE